MIERKLNGVTYTTIKQWFEVDRRSTQAIAQTLGCTRQRVSQVLRAQGVDVSTIGSEIRHSNISRRMASRALKLQLGRIEKQSHRREAKEQKYQQMIWLWGQGKSSTQIAAATKRKVATVREAIRRLRLRYGWFPKRKIVKELNTNN